MATYGLGGGLAGMAQTQQAEATGLLGKAAQQEAELEMTNKSMKQQQKAGNASLGATSGAMIGMSVGGPWGAAVGALVGGVAGGLF